MYYDLEPLVRRDIRISFWMGVVVGVGLVLILSTVCLIVG